MKRAGHLAIGGENTLEIYGGKEQGIQKKGWEEQGI
jgi:hypothetical protein